MPRSSSNEELVNKSDMGTLLKPDVLNKHLLYMSEHPGEPYTFHARTGKLVAWLWPAEGPRHVAVDPRSLTTVIKKHGLALPLCFCVSERHGDRISNAVELVKRDGSYVFKCRSTEGCGYRVSLDKFNPRLVATEDIDSLARTDGFLHFMRAGIFSPPDEITSATYRAVDSGSSAERAEDFAAIRGHASSHGGRSTSPEVIDLSSPGPSRTVGRSYDGARYAPYGHKDRADETLMSPPRFTIERERRQYASISGSTHVAAPPPALSVDLGGGETAQFHKLSQSEVNEIPPELLFVANILAKEGLNQAEFNGFFSLSKCGRVVFKQEIDNGHALACDTCRVAA